MKIGFVVSEFHYDITQMMLQCAKEHAKFLGADTGDTIAVPGVFDMPLAVKKMLQDEKNDAVVTLGAVVEGDTSHDDVVAQHAARKITDLSLEFNKPVGLGISGPKVTRAQAAARIDGYARRSVEAVVKLSRALGQKS